MKLDIKGRDLKNIDAFAAARPEQNFHIEADLAASEYYLIGYDVIDEGKLMQEIEMEKAKAQAMDQAQAKAEMEADAERQAEYEHSGDYQGD